MKSPCCLFIPPKSCPLYIISAQTASNSYSVSLLSLVYRCYPMAWWWLGNDYTWKNRRTVGCIVFNAVHVISKGLLFTQFLIKIYISNNTVLTDNMKRIINIKLRGISISWMNWTLRYKEQITLSVRCSRKKWQRWREIFSCGNSKCHWFCYMLAFSENRKAHWH
jgi:hypothetical protein